MSRLSKQHFWEWFKRHHPEYVSLKNKSKKEINYLLNELTAHLRAYFKFFGFSIECVKDKPARLTISVNGQARHFKKAEDLVAKAPKISGWIFVALEDPRPIDFFLEQQMKATGIDPREFYFSFERNDPHNAGLVVYHPLCTKENVRVMYCLAYDAVYNLLGERSFGNDISWMEVENLSYTDPAKVEELEKLPAYMALRRSEMVIDGEGNLVVVD